MDHVVSLCEDPLSFPRNLTCINKSAYSLNLYNSKVLEDGSRVFCKQCREGLTFWDFSRNAQGKLRECFRIRIDLPLTRDKAFESMDVKTLEGLKAHLGVAPLKEEPHPGCRFL